MNDKLDSEVLDAVNQCGQPTFLAIVVHVAGGRFGKSITLGAITAHHIAASLARLVEAKEVKQTFEKNRPYPVRYRLVS